jgi:hypothetical protein
MSNKRLDNVIEAKKRLLFQEAETYSNLTDHKPEKGRLNESHLAKCIREYLPTKMGIGTGFIESCGGHQSRQQDIIIYDAFNNVPLYSSDSWAVYPIEMVYATIEVKTTLTKSELTDIFKKCGSYVFQENNDETRREINTKSIPQMVIQDKKWYLLKANLHVGQTDQQIPFTLGAYIPKPEIVPPRFYIFAYKTSYKKLDSLREDLKKLSVKYDLHFHGICILEKDWFIAEQAKRDSTEPYRDIFLEKNGFKAFLNQLHLNCEILDLGLVDRSKYISGIDRILPILSIPEQVET